MSYILVINVVLMLLRLNNGIASDLLKGIPSYIFAVMFIIFLIMEIANKRLKNYLNKENIVIGLFLLLAIFGYVQSSHHYLLIVIQGLICFVVCYCFKIGLVHLNRKFLYVVFGILLFDYIFVAISSLFTYQVLPDISRILASQTLDEIRIANPLLKIGSIGGFGFCYALPILILVSVHFLCKKKYLFAFPLLLFSYTLWKASYMIAVICCVIMLIVYFYFQAINKHLNKQKKIILFSSICIIVFVAIINLGSINNFLADRHFIPQEYSARLIQIEQFFSTGKLAAEEDLGLRLNLYYYSVDGIFQNKGLFNFNPVIASAHSTILDMISVFGIFASALFYFLFKSIKNFFTTLPKGGNAVLIAVLFYFGSVALLNNMLVPQVAVVIYIFFPLTMILFEEKND